MEKKNMERIERREKGDKEKQERQTEKGRDREKEVGGR